MSNTCSIGLVGVSTQTMRVFAETSARNSAGSEPSA
jgi:hypothetical protein